MCLTQGHNAVTPVKLGPTASRYRVKHSTTEPLRSQEGVRITHNDCAWFVTKVSDHQYDLGLKGQCHLLKTCLRLKKQTSLYLCL